MEIQHKISKKPACPRLLSVFKGVSMNYLNQIQRSVDYIEAHLAQPIAINAVAREAGMSQWHFQRMFRGLTGDTVKDYIRSRRLVRAQDALLNSDQRIIDIALDADFDSQESFTRAFKAAFNATPAQYRRTGKRHPFPQKIKFDPDYLRHIHRGMDIVPEIYRQKPSRFVGMRTRFYGSDSERNNIGEKLPPLWQQFLMRLSEIRHAIGGTCYGIVRQLAEDSDELEYVCAVEVTAFELIPAGMLTLEQPACTYAKFAHRGAVNLIDNTVNYIYSTRLSQSGTRHVGTADLEFYGAGYSPGSPDSLMHYAIPITSSQQEHTA
ncbi:MAG: helix-turn-helix domain-containing protein [Pseudomonadota bacterium]